MIAVFVGLLGAVAAVFYFVSTAFAAPGVPAPTITSSPSNPSTVDLGHLHLHRHPVRGELQVLPRLVELHYLCLGDQLHLLCRDQPHLQGRGRRLATPRVLRLPTPGRSCPPRRRSPPSRPTRPRAASASFKYSDTLSGVTFQCALDSSSYSSCSSSGVTYTLSSSGSHTFSVKAQSGSATSAAASYTWTVKTPAPSIVSEPANPVALSSAVFTYSDSQSGVSFKCSLDSSSFSTCASSGVSYNGLSDGTHSFSVEAQLGSGPVSSATSYSWRVDTTPPSDQLEVPRQLRRLQRRLLGGGVLARRHLRHRL